MKHSIDYLAFTVLAAGQYQSAIQCQQAAREHCQEAFNVSLSFGKGIRTGVSATANPLPGFYVHIGNGWLLYEFTGQGCQWLNERGFMSGVLLEFGERVTRLDVCTDILTDCSVLDFATARDEKRTKSFSHVSSPTGETVYIGSRASNRSCKVYRYAPPHPRSSLLRVEHTLRVEDARFAVGVLIQGETVEGLARSLSARYGWLHEAWKASDTDIPLSAYRAPREKGSTVRWIYSQVLPAIETLARQGLIDIEALITELERMK